MDAQLTRVRDRHLLMLERSLKIISHIVGSADRAALTGKRDGPDGWTPLEILCHLRDLEDNFIRRARSVVEQDRPTFILLPVNEMVVERDYNAQDPLAALTQFAAGRADLLAYFAGVRDDDWTRAGLHPERGEQSLIDVLMHVAHHDHEHIEQMTRILAGPA